MKCRDVNAGITMKCRDANADIIRICRDANAGITMKCRDAKYCVSTNRVPACSEGLDSFRCNDNPS